MLQNGTESAEKADYFRLEWMGGGYRLNGNEKKHVQLLGQCKRYYMTGRSYTEESGFVKATHRLEGDIGMLLWNGMARKVVSTNGFVCLSQTNFFLFLNHQEELCGGVNGVSRERRNKHPVRIEPPMSGVLVVGELVVGKRHFWRYLC
jgi:hypothetical protein